MKKILMFVLVAVSMSLSVLGLVACGGDNPAGSNDGGTDGHEHAFSQEWSYDAEYHWHAAVCEHTGEVKDKARHVLEKGICTVCKYAPVTAGLEFELSYDGSHYILKSLGEAVNSDSIIIPAEYKGLPVTEIDYQAFENAVAVKTLSVPETVMGVMSGTFQACQVETASVTVGLLYDLNTASLTDLTVVGEGEMRSNGNKEYPSLVNLTLPYLGASPEDEFGTLKNFFGFGGVPSSLKTLTLTKVKTLGGNAFEGGSGVERIDLPASLTKVDFNTFYGCAAATYNIAEDNPVLCIKDGIIYDKAEKDFLYVPSSLSGRVEILDGIVEIRNSQFAGMSGITEIVLPDSVQIIADSAFSQCASLKTVEFGNGLKSIGNYAFANTALESAEIPDSTDTFGFNVFSGCNSMHSITVPFVGNKKNNADITAFAVIFERRYTSGYNPVEYYVAPQSLKKVVVTGGADIPALAFADLEYVEEIELKGNVTTFGDSAFARMTSLERITVPIGLTHVGAATFMDCTALAAFSANGMSELGNYAFKNCSMLETVQLGNGLNTIGEEAFFGCTALSEFDFPNALEEIGVKAFMNCSSLEEAVLPNGLTALRQNAFYGCAKLNKIEAGNGLTEIGSALFDGCAIKSAKVPVSLAASVSCGTLQSVNLFGGEVTARAFANCSALGEIVFDSSVTGLGESAFENCTALETVVLNAELQEFGSGVFAGCESLLSVTVEDGVPYIGESMFADCVSLPEITLPSSVAEIRVSAFSDAAKLERVNGASGLTVIEARAFSGCEALTAAPMPSGLEEIGDACFAGCSLLENPTFPSSLQAIGASAFVNCVSFDKVTVPSSVERLGQYAFSNCTNLKEAEIHYTSMGLSVLYGCSALQKITVASNQPINVSQLNHIGMYFAIRNEGGQIDVQTGIPASLKTVTLLGDGVPVKYFEGCDIEEIRLPNVYSIGTQAFSYCTSLKRVVLSANLGSIDKNAFEGCSINDVFYYGTNQNNVTFEDGNSTVRGRDWYYYSETTPVYDPYGHNKWWHYVDDVITKYVIEQ